MASSGGRVGAAGIVLLPRLTVAWGFIVNNNESTRPPSSPTAWRRDEKRSRIAASRPKGRPRAACVLALICGAKPPGWRSVGTGCPGRNSNCGFSPITFLQDRQKYPCQDSCWRNLVANTVTA
jgi:hypothetical protein